MPTKFAANGINTKAIGSTILTIVIRLARLICLAPISKEAPSAIIMMPAICGRTSSIEIIAIAISSLRLGRFNAAHKAKPTAKKEMESFPSAEDQKLIDGRKIISKVHRRVLFEQEIVSDFMLA